MMGEIWSKSSTEVLEYLEFVEITSCSVVGELYMKFVRGWSGKKSMEFVSARSLRMMKDES